MSGTDPAGNPTRDCRFNRARCPLEQPPVKVSLDTFARICCAISGTDNRPSGRSPVNITVSDVKLVTSLSSSEERDEERRASGEERRAEGGEGGERRREARKGQGRRREWGSVRGGRRKGGGREGGGKREKGRGKDAY
eukprot:1848801-Rhodomonas_salina.1